MTRFQITIVRPLGYQHSDCFRELAETLLYGLRALGHSASIQENAFDPCATNILLGAHLLTPQQTDAIPRGSVIYNLEQIGGANLPGTYYDLSARHQIWDYSELNIKRWAQLGCASPPVLVEVAYAPDLSRIAPAPQQDIDVLFYGSINERRQSVITKLREVGLKVTSIFGLYGKPRDELIARSKLVLNVHFYETQLFEIVRVSYLLANSKAVVTEDSPDLGDLKDAVAVFPYDSLVEGCLSLLADKTKRKELEAAAFQAFAERRIEDVLRRVIGGSHAIAAVAPIQKLNLGSGKDWRVDCLNVDFNPYWQPDLVLDFSKPLPIGERLQTFRFGPIRLEKNSFDEIIANDVLEHIPSLTTAMTSCLALLKVGGTFWIQVPYDLSWGAWQDPTHLRAFNERSWLYYTDWFWYLGWTEARFEVAHIEFGLSPIGEELRKTLQGRDLIRQPRAIDLMKVALRKRLLTDEEKRIVTRYMARPHRWISQEAPNPRD
jgi:SAM-dependent methyltransferase